MDKVIQEAREQYVVKANEVIQKSKSALTAPQLKALSFILSKVKPSDSVKEWYQFTISEYCDVLGIAKGGRGYEIVKNSIKSLVDKESFWMPLADGSEVTVRWIEKALVNYGSGKIKVRLDEDMQKFVIGLQSNYTQYSLLAELPMRSAYSIKIYELLKSYSNLGEHFFPLDDLKSKLCAEHYKRFPDFRRKVLETATKEINQYSDLIISWIPEKAGNKVIGIRYRIERKSMAEWYHAEYRDHKQLEGQLNIFDVGAV